MTRKRRPVIKTSMPANKPNSGLVIGPATIIPAALRRLGCAWQWDNGARGFLVPIGRLPDIEAMLTTDGLDVQPQAPELR